MGEVARVGLGLTFSGADSMTEQPWTGQSALLFIYSLPVVLVLAHNLNMLIINKRPAECVESIGATLRNKDDLFLFFGR